MANSLPLTETELMAIFAQQTNWQDRYRQIIQLAKQLPNLAEEQKTAERLVAGCENRVWLDAELTPSKQFIFYGDSEGRIVKGLLAILLILVNNKTAEQILAIDFNQCFSQLKITQELSQSRQIGLQKLVERVQEIVRTSRLIE